MTETHDKRNLRVTIIRNADGVAATSKPDDWLGFNFRRYWWEEGNAACDCNRGDWFRRYRGEPGDTDSPCGDSLYRVKVEDQDTGEVLYEEPAP